MPEYGNNSKKNLATCHPDIQLVGKTTIRGYDHHCSEGYRGKEKQNKAFKKGLSKLQYPHGKHNQEPSKAVHWEPYPVIYPDNYADVWLKLSVLPKDEALPYLIRQIKLYGRFYHFAGYVKRVCQELDVDMVWGVDWDQDGDFFNNSFDDYAHWHLK